MHYRKWSREALVDPHHRVGFDLCAFLLNRIIEPDTVLHVAPFQQLDLDGDQVSTGVLCPAVQGEGNVLPRQAGPVRHLRVCFIGHLELYTLLRPTVTARESRNALALHVYEVVVFAETIRRWCQQSPAGRIRIPLWDLA